MKREAVSRMPTKHHPFLFEVTWKTRHLAWSSHFHFDNPRIFTLKPTDWSSSTQPRFSSIWNLWFFVWTAKISWHKRLQILIERASSKALILLKCQYSIHCKLKSLPTSTCYSAPFHVRCLLHINACHIVLTYRKCCLGVLSCAAHSYFSFFFNYHLVRSDKMGISI